MGRRRKKRTTTNSTSTNDQVTEANLSTENVEELASVRNIIERLRGFVPDFTKVKLKQTYLTTLYVPMLPEQLPFHYHTIPVDKEGLEKMVQTGSVDEVVKENGAKILEKLSENLKTTSIATGASKIMGFAFNCFPVRLVNYKVIPTTIELDDSVFIPSIPLNVETTWEIETEWLGSEKGVKWVGEIAKIADTILFFTEVLKRYSPKTAFFPVKKNTSKNTYQPVITETPTIMEVATTNNSDDILNNYYEKIGMEPPKKHSQTKNNNEQITTRKTWEKIPLTEVLKNMGMLELLMKFYEENKQDIKQLLYANGIVPHVDVVDEETIDVSNETITEQQTPVNNKSEKTPSKPVKTAQNTNNAKNTTENTTNKHEHSLAGKTQNFLGRKTKTTNNHSPAHSLSNHEYRKRKKMTMKEFVKNTKNKNEPVTINSNNLEVLVSAIQTIIQEYVPLMVTGTKKVEIARIGKTTPETTEKILRKKNVWEKAVKEHTTMSYAIRNKDALQIIQQIEKNVENSLGKERTKHANNKPPKNTIEETYTIRITTTNTLKPTTITIEKKQRIMFLRNTVYCQSCGFSNRIELPAGHAITRDGILLFDYWNLGNIPNSVTHVVGTAVEEMPSGTDPYLENYAILCKKCGTPIPYEYMIDITNTNPHYFVKSLLNPEKITANIDRMTIVDVKIPTTEIIEKHSIPILPVIMTTNKKDILETLKTINKYLCKQTLKNKDGKQQNSEKTMKNNEAK